MQIFQIGNRAVIEEVYIPYLTGQSQIKWRANPFSTPHELDAEDNLSIKNKVACSKGSKSFLTVSKTTSASTLKYPCAIWSLIPFTAFHGIEGHKDNN